MKKALVYTCIKNLSRQALAHLPHDVQERLKQELYALGLQARANGLNFIVRFEHTDYLVHQARHPVTMGVDCGVRCLRDSSCPYDRKVVESVPRTLALVT